MADSAPDNPHALPTPGAAGLPAAPAAPRRHSRLTTAIAVLALATAGYALWRDATRDHLDQVKQQVAQLESAHSVLRAEIQTLSNHEQLARRELEQRLDALNDTPRQLQEFGAVLEELRGRTEGPERAWSRAEAFFLLELAQRRLTLDRDIDTAIVVLEAADSRLAALRDPEVAAVRQQIGKEIQSLRAVPRPDTTGILVRLTNAEEQAGLAAVRGIVPIATATPGNALPQGGFARAWAVARNAITGLISVRKVDRGSSIVTLEEQALRRQHLQLLLFSARAAVVRHDNPAYRSALAGARQWLGEFFDLTDPSAALLLDEIQRPEPIDIDPRLPDIAASARALQRLMPAQPTSAIQPTRPAGR